MTVIQVDCFDIPFTILLNLIFRRKWFIISQEGSLHKFVHNKKSQKVPKPHYWQLIIPYVLLTILIMRPMQTWKSITIQYATTAVANS